MKTEKDLNYHILEMIIEEAPPEQPKNINEIQISISETNVSKMNIKNLKDYYDTLNILLTTNNPNVNKYQQVFCG